MSLIDDAYKAPANSNLRWIGAQNVLEQAMDVVAGKRGDIAGTAVDADTAY
jgi:hypothetical protein